MISRPLAFATLSALSSLVFAFPTPTAEQRFRDLESLLTRAGRFDVRAHAVSRGAVTSDLNADLGVANSGIVTIRLHGTLSGKPDNVTMRTDGVVTMMTKGEDSQRLQPGQAMRQSVQIGFLRMGLWHNLLLLSHGMQPEHNEGGITSWASVDHIRYASTSREGMTGLSFDVVIEGKKAGDATLWIDNVSRMPIRREQTLNVEGKKIETVEDYSNFIPTA